MGQGIWMICKTLDLIWQLLQLYQILTVSVRPKSDNWFNFANDRKLNISRYWVCRSRLGWMIMKPSFEADKFCNPKGSLMQWNLVISKHLLGFALLYPAYGPVLHSHAARGNEWKLELGGKLLNLLPRLNRSQMIYGNFIITCYAPWGLFY